MRRWYDNLIHFIINGEPQANFIEGFFISDTTADVSWECWIDSKTNTAHSTNYLPVHFYSRDEVVSMLDLILEGSYPLPLSVSYGPPKFTPELLLMLKNSRHKSLKYDRDILYPEIGPRRRRGRPKKRDYAAEVESSNLESVKFNKHDDTLTVKFRTGRTYEYYGVPFKRYYYLVKRASSKGKYFHKKIRFSYPYREL